MTNPNPINLPEVRQFIHEVNRELTHEAFAWVLAARSHESVAMRALVLGMKLGVFPRERRAALARRFGWSRQRVQRVVKELADFLQS